VRSDAGGATARFADGSEARGDLLIAAEGLRSAVRARLLPKLQPAYAGYVAWRALMPESETVRANRDILERDYLFCAPHGSVLAANQSIIVPAGRKHGFRSTGERALHIRATLAAPGLVALHDDQREAQRRWLP
jgi:2-polyprenyl-6-methoxyphenol hydroxylase-like FAD-dependent oxidoreductase